ncbi:MAG: hypothetical protein HW412_2333 [Bacteroidetes bacterium]|nr:hypothetical protein [Bacteroidota bacterium]
MGEAVQIVTTIVFLGFILGSLCDVIASLIHSPRSDERVKQRRLHGRLRDQESRTDRNEWETPIAM